MNFILSNTIKNSQYIRHNGSQATALYSRDRPDIEKARSGTTVSSAVEMLGEGLLKKAEGNCSVFEKLPVREPAADAQSLWKAPLPQVWMLWTEALGRTPPWSSVLND